MTSLIHEQRLDAVIAVLRASGARSVADLGCGGGDLLVRLAADATIGRVAGLEQDRAVLGRARARIAGLPPGERDKLHLFEGSLTEPPPELAGHEAVVMVEVIEHLAPDRLGKLEQVLFRRLAPAILVITTPNAEFNGLLGVPAKRWRHPDHHFEWERAKFRTWAEGVARRQGHDFMCSDIAGAHPVLGGASQMVVFRQK